MANINPAIPATFANVRQLEITDPLEGGPGGILNEQAQNLVDRTQYLKDRLDKMWLKKGVQANVDVTGNDMQIPITFASVGTSNYQVVACIVSKGNPVNDNDITWSTRSESATGFTLLLSDPALSSSVQNIDIKWALLNLDLIP